MIASNKAPIGGKPWRKAVRQTAALVFLAVAVGMTVNHFSFDQLPLVGDWSPDARLATKAGRNTVVSFEEARRLCESQEAVFVDARASAAYLQGHILCARNLPFQGLDAYLFPFVSEIRPEEPIIVYCDGEECSLSEDVAKKLLSLGYQDVRVLVNGWTRWVEAGLPIERGHGTRSKG